MVEGQECGVGVATLSIQMLWLSSGGHNWRRGTTILTFFLRYGFKMVYPDTAPHWKAPKWSRQLQHYNSAKHQWQLPSLPAYVRVGLLAYVVPNEHTPWNSQFLYSFHYALLIGKTAAEFIFLNRRSLRISSSTHGKLCISVVQGRLRRLSPTSVPPVSAFSIPGFIFEQDSCPQLLHHHFEPTFMNTIVAKWSGMLKGFSEVVVSQIKQKMYGDKKRMHFFPSTFRVRNAICLSDIEMSLNKRL